MSTQAPDYIYALDAHMINNAVHCIHHDFPYSMYISWLDQFVCTEKPDLMLNRLEEDTYNKLYELAHKADYL